MLLACELSSLPSIPRLFGDRVRFFSSEFAPLQLFARMASAGLLPCPFPALGSVGVAAVNAALRLTSGEIFLTGLDFSYPRLQTHARGTPYHLSALVGASRLSAPDGPSFRAISARRRGLAEDKHGKRVLTDSVLESYGESLRRIVAGAGPGCWMQGPRVFPWEPRSSPRVSCKRECAAREEERRPLNQGVLPFARRSQCARSSGPSVRSCATETVSFELPSAPGRPPRSAFRFSVKRTTRGFTSRIGPEMGCRTEAFLPGHGRRQATTLSGFAGWNHSSEVLSTARNAVWGSSTSPTIFMRFFPSFCFSSSFRLRVMSPP